MVCDFYRSIIFHGMELPSFRWSNDFLKRHLHNLKINSEHLKKVEIRQAIEIKTSSIQ